ncbi:MAG: hypothetical protein HYS06_01825 [Methylocystis sp.]|nr:hypothetical protein [Methylocystis sp.]MBI3274408.1 hypothetical protein [Methylocystis sp.]
MKESGKTVEAAAGGTVIGGSLFNSINPLSLNEFPDVIGKAAWDPTIGDPPARCLSAGHAGQAGRHGTRRS